MQHFRKKPVVIQAVQFIAGEIPIELLQHFTTGKIRLSESRDELIIKTLEGDMTASDRDWIIIGVKGEIYPCKPDVFEMTYERVRVAV